MSTDPEPAPADPGRSARENGSGRTRVPRTVTAALVAAIALSPLVAHVVGGETAWFAWHMFSQVNGELAYEVRIDGEWRAVDLDELSWWDRGAHIGDTNLESLCGVEREAAAARRLVDAEVDAQVSCS